ncbi:MAG: ATP-binding protein [Armatimonadetes bacterium]|nr:ATP-binding protein [Armatimonadota bacterium]
MTTPIIELRVPCSPEYVSVVRLAVLGLCGRIPLSYDEVEDLRLAVGEACASSVYRASQVDSNNAHIQVVGAVDSARIVLEIRDDVPLAPETESTEEDSGLEADFDNQQFRVSLMQLLVDSVEIGEAEGGGQIVRLVKNCELNG